MLRPTAGHGLRAVATTALTLTLGLTLAPAARATTDGAPATGGDDDAGPVSDTGTDPALREAAQQDEPEAAQAVRVRLRIGRATVRRVSTTRSRARGLLVDENVAVDRDDQVRLYRGDRRVTSSAARTLRAGDAVRVVRVATSATSTRQRIRRRTLTRLVSHLRPGQRRVVRRGHPGTRRVTVRRTRHNGRVVKVRRTTRVLRAPVVRRVLVGRPYGSVPGADRLHWGALARCESGNNPHAVNPAGFYGLYQFSRGTWVSVGGTGLPSRAPAAEQTYRAKKLWKARGRSPWPHCGRLL